MMKATLSLLDLEEMARRVAALPTGPRLIYVRRSAWPWMSKLFQECATAHHLSSIGLPVVLVDDLPVVWCTDVEFESVWISNIQEV